MIRLKCAVSLRIGLTCGFSIRMLTLSLSVPTSYGILLCIDILEISLSWISYMKGKRKSLLPHRLVTQNGRGKSMNGRKLNFF